MTTETLTPAAPEKRRLNTGDKLGTQTRFLQLRADDAPGDIIDIEARTLELTWSSEQLVERWWGEEILSHAPGAARLARLNDSAPLLFNHNMDDVIGVVERAEIGKDKRGHAVVRFAKTPRADEIVSMINDRILRNVSFMYQVYKYVASELDGDGDVDEYTGTDWEPFEISIVSVPADPSVGVGRSLSIDAASVQVERPVRSPANVAETPCQTRKESDMKKHFPLQEAAEAATSVGGGVTAPAPINADAMRAEGARAERDRVSAIEIMGKRHGLKHEQIQKLVVDGVSVELARGIVLDMLASRSQNGVAAFDPNIVDLTAREKAKYSMLRAVNAALNSDWKEAGFEREVSETIAKQRGVTSKGFFIPMNLPFCPDEEHARAYRMQNGRAQVRAPYLVGTAAQGGNLVETNLMAENFIEVLRNQSVTAMLGARILSGLVGNVDIPRQISASQTYWVGESVAPTESEGTFDKVSLRPKTIGALSKMSRLMLLQATPAVEMIARADLLAVMALGMDLAAISGSGSGGQPTGIINQANVGSVIGGTNGANLSFDHIIQLQYATKAANAPQASTGYALNSKSIGYLSTQKATTGQYLWDPQGGLTNASPDRLKGRAYAESQQMRSTLTKGTASGICSELVYGNWQELLIAEWGVTEITVNPFDSTGFTTGDVWIRAFQTMDIGVRHGGSFAAMSDALTPGF